MEEWNDEFTGQTSLSASLPTMATFGWNEQDRDQKNKIRNSWRIFEMFSEVKR